MIKYFDISTMDGLKKAELCKQRAYNKYNSVKVIPNGLNKIVIIGE